MEIIEVTTIIDETGYLNLDLLTQVPPGKVKIKVIIQPIIEAVTRPNYDFFDLISQLAWQGDAVAQQRALRDEW